ncbi:Ribonuclease VapC3 [Metallosphaera sp. J1]|uniref:type II toxin-antitoxin system VapC family toxin n=1 Tax=Metallosphaera TaxID=41980 RepID=UPI001EDD96E2|nr:type II toxin-antitoxin system VapC family toxin [Metallosphaera javensis (ex Hofmann et al. 2022)]MCG3109076.1 Ribonuclease VapC3 [Metallosphaera javensis (ex Hofmann et al. 2022)]BCS93605.1 MAG: PIN domain nuclease [Metallosphaera javensis (ex Sakai et al. 2022)]
MRIVVDTSALVSVFLPESASECVRNLLERYDDLHFLDLIYYEFPNVMRKRVVRGEISAEDGEMVVTKGLNFISNFPVHQGRELAQEAYRLSVKYGITTYDASLVALANTLGGEVLTLDLKLISALKGERFVSCS